MVQIVQVIVGVHGTNSTSNSRCTWYSYSHLYARSNHLTKGLFTGKAYLAVSAITTIEV